MITGISVKCEVARGTFASEYFVRIKAVHHQWQAAVDKEMVFDLTREPRENEYVNGRMYAYLINFNSESALIELPIEDSTTGRRIFVSTSSIRKEQVPA